MAIQPILPFPLGGTPFSVGSAAQTGLASVRIVFTAPPALSGTGSALVPSRYVLSGPTYNAVNSVSAVPGQPLSLDLFLFSNLGVGTWQVSVSNVLSQNGGTLVAPTSATFGTQGMQAPPPLSGGGSNDDEEALLRKHLNPALKGPGWDALIAAFATGDAYNRQTAVAAFDQLFKCSAQDFYLDRKASDVGLTRPPTIGIDQEVFRKLLIKTTASKLTHEVILESLEAYYGSDATRANVSTQVFQPFIIHDGDSLVLQIDDGAPTTVIFSSDDFAAPGSASATEVAASITRSLRRAGFTAFAIAAKDPATGNTSVKIYTGTLGLRGSIRVLGGSSQSNLFFPNLLSIYTGS